MTDKAAANGKLALTCTGRGHHTLAALGAIRVINGLVIYDPQENSRRMNTAKKAPAGWSRTRADGGATFIPFCRRCKRERPIRHERAVQAVQAGLTTVDISLL